MADAAQPAQAAPPGPSTIPAPAGPGRLRRIGSALCALLLAIAVVPPVFFFRHPLSIPLFVLPCVYFYLLWHDRLWPAVGVATAEALYGLGLYILRGRAILSLLAIRYLLKRRIAIVAVLSVTLCTAMVLVVGSIMEGFLKSAREAMHGARGDLSLKADFQGFPFYEEFEKRILENHPDFIDPATGKSAVERCAVLTHTFGLLRSSFGGSNPVNTVQVAGIRPQDIRRNRKFLLGLDRSRPHLVLPEPALGELEKDGVTGESLSQVKALRSYRFETAQEWDRALESILNDGAIAAAEIARIKQAVLKRLVRRAFDEKSELSSFDVPDLSGRPIMLRTGAQVPGGGMIVGKELVSFRDHTGRLIPQLDRNEPIRLTTVPPASAAEAELENSSNRLFLWADYHKSGVYELDRQTVYVDFALLQEMLRMEEDREQRRPAYAHNVQIDLAAGTSLERGRSIVRRAWKRMLAEIEAAQRALFRDPNAVPTVGPKYLLRVDEPGPGSQRTEPTFPDIRKARLNMAVGRLIADVRPGERELVVSTSSGFDPGDDIVLRGGAQEAEFHVVADVRPGRITLKEPVKHGRPASVEDRLNLGGGFVQSPGFGGTVYAQTWEESMQTFLTAVQKEKVMMLTLFGIISMVAVLLVLSIFIQIVKEKTRDIGILKSVGASAGSVAGAFLMYAACIGVVGTVAGIALGCGIIHYINEIHDVVASITGVVIWDPSVYVLPKIPNIVDPMDAAWVGSIGILASLLAAVVPAGLAARLPPVRALAYE